MKGKAVAAASPKKAAEPKKPETTAEREPKKAAPKTEEAAEEDDGMTEFFHVAIRRINACVMTFPNNFWVFRFHPSF